MGDAELNLASSLIAAIKGLYPNAQITSGYRGPNNPLTRINPRSMHALGSPDDPRAVDVAPIPGVSFADYVASLKNNGVQVAQAFDEATHPFPWTTGPNWHIATVAPSSNTPKPHSTGTDTMAVNSSLYPVVNGVDPLAPEPVQQPVPIAASAGPSVNVPSASPVATKKRGGILGALESVFMPDPGSQWAGALRDGLTNAKESQQLYREQQQQKALDLATANIKLKNLMTKGEYQVVGNNVVHYFPAGQTGPDGKGYELITPPSGMDDKIKYAGVIANMPEGPAKELMKSVLLGNYGNTPEGAAAHEAATVAAAKARAGATIQAARIRGPSASTINVTPPIPPNWKVVH